ncbi:MAG: hypothetical protein HOP31_09030, partial [Ignavibacteria bacterium]|nr:hypothetical protein [Ignavibacteria bacterium]
MGEIVKYNSNDPLFDETHLENLYKDNYKEFHNLSNYFKDLDINIYNDKFLPIIVKKSVFIKLSDRFDKFEKSFTAELRDNKIEFS